MMNVQTLTKGLLVLVVATFVSLSAQAKTVATVNGEKISSEEVKAAYDTLPKESRRPLNEIYGEIVNRLVDQRLLEQAANKAKIGDEKTVKANLERIVARLLREEFVRRQIKDKVTDSKVKARYKELKGNYEGKEEVRASHILVKDEAKAKKLIVKLEKGAKFDELAKKESTGPSAARGGDLGYFVREAMVPAFANAAFLLEKGKYTNSPIQTRFGWHIIKVEDKRIAKAPPLKDVEGEIRRALTDQAIADVVAKLRKDAKVDVKATN